VRTHLAEILLGHLFREAEHPPATDLDGTSAAARDGARQDLMSEAGDRDLRLLAMRRHDVATVHQPTGVAAQVAEVLTADVPGQRGTRRPVGVRRKVFRFRTEQHAMNEVVVANARAVQFEERAATPLPGTKRAGLDPVPHFETNHEVARAATREAPLRGEAHPLERLRRPRGVARQETHSQYQVAGVRSSLRIVRIALLGTARHIARPHVGILLVAQVQRRVGRRVRE
jgi:hypothetical protein